MKIEPCEHSAYTITNAYESISFDNYDPINKVYNVSIEDLEHFARIIAYKTASNLDKGLKMDPYIDPLLYVDCEDYKCI